MTIFLKAEEFFTNRSGQVENPDSKATFEKGKKRKNVTKYHANNIVQKVNYEHLNLTDKELITLGKKLAEKKSGYKFGDAYDFREFTERTVGVENVD